MEELVQSLNWFDGSEEELVRELLDNDSPFFLLPAAERTTTKTDQSTSSISSSSEEPPEMISRPVSSNVYSGPTIGDIETALSLTNSSTTESTSTANSIISRFGISILEKGLSKVDNKYTLKIKSCGDGMQDDGYKWRKYGQKSIKNSSNPRSYYRCTNPRCSAKKQVERSNEDPDMLIITYEGLHLHFTYSHFLPNQTHNAYPPMKKPKLSSSTSQNHDQQDKEEAQAVETLPAVEPSQESALLTDLQPDLFEGTGSQGLLEDMVPMMIRKPLPNTSTWSNSSCSSSYSSSPPTSSSSFSWSPNCSNEVGIISSTSI